MTPTGSQHAVTGIHRTQHSTRLPLWAWLVAGPLGLATVAIVLVATVAALRYGHRIDPNLLLTALITAIGSVGTALTAKLNKVGTNSERTTDNVANSHDTNLRDDIDRLNNKVDTVVDQVMVMVQEQREQRADVLGIRKDIGQIRKSERDQWEAIEDTAGKIRRKGD